MSNPGDEFRIRAAPTQEQLRKLLYLATQDSDSVQTGAIRSVRDFGVRGGKEERHGGFAAFAQIIAAEQQARAERIAALGDRLDELDRASLAAVKQAEEHLAGIRRSANRTSDGRLAFEAEDGTIRDEHGNELRQDEIDRDEWDETAPKWKDFQDAQQDVDAAAEFRRNVRDAREQLDDKPGDEDLDALEERIGALETTARDLRHTDPAEQRRAAEEAHGPRSTSAAKRYDQQGEPPTVTALNAPFQGAADPAQPDPPDRPQTAPQPAAPFQPD